MKPAVRKGQFTGMHDRHAFGERFRQRFVDPAFDRERAALQRIERIAWEAYDQARKAPRTHEAGAGFADPDYALSDDWRATRDRLLAAQQRWHDTKSRSRALVVVCASRNDGSCPGEMSKTFRLAQVARESIERSGIEVDLLDLSRLTSDYARHIHPCKGCTATWPASRACGAR
jgi:hypothetical protein